MKSLQDEIDKRAQEIHTDRYSMSISEAVAMYSDNELEIHPEFQRIFRWSIEQQSRLIESIFLGIPVPPVFVAQRKDGVWDVVDGVQRLSTIFRFMNVLRTDSDEPDRPQPLTKGEYLTKLAGIVWESDDEGGRRQSRPTLSESQRRVFKRARLDFHIVQKESDERAKFDLFQRLNSGTRLSEQEARNCLAVMLDPSFSRWLYSCAEFEHYDSTMDISERRERESYGVESVLRYLACARTHTQELFKMGDVGEFLTNSMRDFIEGNKFDRNYERRRFEFVFRALDEALGSDAFKRPSPRGGFGGTFSISAFEAIASGIARNYDSWKDVPLEVRNPELIERVRSTWENAVFKERAGGGKPANRRIPFLVEAGEQIFAR